MNVMFSLGLVLVVPATTVMCCAALWMVFMFESEEIEKIAERLRVFDRRYERKYFSQMCAGAIIAANLGVAVLMTISELSVIKLVIIQILMFLFANNVLIPVMFANYGDFTLKQVFLDPVSDYIQRHLQSIMPEHDDDTQVQGSSNAQSNVNTNQDTNEEDNSNSDNDSNASDSDSAPDNHLATNGGSGGSGDGCDLGDGLYGELLGFSGIGAATTTDDAVVEQPLIARSFTNAVSQSDMDSRRNSADTIIESVARQRYIDRCLRELEYNRCTMPADEYADAVAAAKAAVGFSDFTNGNPFVVPDEEDDGDDPLDELFSDMEDNVSDDGFEGDDDPYGFNSPRRAPGRMARQYTTYPIDW